MIPIGATVRWRPTIDKRAAVIGVATARRPERTGDQIEIDRRDWWVSEGLLEVVGMTEDFMGHRDADSETARVLHMELTAAVAERDALRELVVAQATKNAELAQQIADGHSDKIEELQEWIGNAQSYVEDLLLLFMGERRPVRPIEPPELRRLAEFAFEEV